MRNSNVRWKTTPQVDFLFGNAPPLACTTLNLSTGTAHGNERAGNESSDALHYNTSTDRPITSSGTEVDARNTANFRTTGYCGQQDMAHTPLVRREFIHYYAKMLERVPAEQPCVTDSDSIVCTGNSSQHKQPQSQDSCRETGHSMTDTTTRAKMAGAETEADGAPASAAVGVKKEECIDDTNDTAMESKGGIRQFSGTAANATSSSLSTFYARGILVQVGDPSTHGGGEAQYTPWEFYIVHDTRDASCYIPALLALHNHASALHANGHSEQPDPLRMRDSHHGSDRHDSYYSHAAYEDADEDDAISQDAHHRPRAFSRHSSLFGRRGDCLLLYTRLAASFTGIHAGMVVGVAGEPFQRSAQGVLTGVVVHRFVLPHDPFLPWTLHRCVQRSNMRTLMHGSKHGTPTHYDSDDDKAGVKGHRGTYTGMLYSQSQSHSSSSSSVRIHFCSGPFPRQDIPALLRSAIVQAIQRDADLLIIGGPLIQPFGEKEKDLLPTLGATFAELLDFYIDTMEETLESYYSSNASTSSSSALLLPSSGVPAQKRIKILVVPHREDVTQTPVLPTTMYALQDTPDIMLRSSPCRIAIAGVHVGVCNEDVVSRMQSAMVERGQVWAGRMERVVQALVRSRLYCPIYRLPAHHVDVRHLGKLHLDYAPVGNELLQLPSSPASAPALPNTEAAGAGGGSDATTATPSARVPAEVPSPSTSTPARLAHKGEQNRTARWRLVSDLHKQDMATVCEWMAQEARLSHNGNTMKRERSDCGDEYDGNSCHAGATRNSRSDGSHVKLPKLTNGQQGGIDANRTSGDDADAAAESPSMDDDSTRKVKTIYVSAAQNDMSSSSGAANEPNATQDTSYTTSKAIHDASDVTESVDAEYDAAETVVETSNSGTYTPDISLAERDIEVEFMPHILFLPSVQSPFAHLTQARVPRYLQSQTSPVWNTSHTNEHNRTGMDECGVLVINQGVWPSQGAGPFEMRVAEVTIPCAEAVARAGTSMLRCSGRRLRQTANPPRRCTPLEENPLMRWSYLLRPWQLASQPLSHSSRPSFVLASATPHIPVSDPCDTLSTRSLILAKSRYCQADTLSHVCVGLEGCRNAFNATCAIRTCQFFGTGQPPRFLSLQGWGDIAHLQRRSLPGHAEVASAANSCTPATTSTEVQVSTTKDTSANARTLPGHDSRREENSASKEACKSCSAGGARVSKVAELQRQTSTLALFGECDFLSPVPTATSIRDASSGEGIVLVALENFTPRSRSIHRCRVPSRAHEVRLIVGDENAGVRACLTAGHDGDTHDLADLLAPTATATSTTATTTAEAIRTTEKTQQKDACVMNTETTRTHHQTIFPAVPKTRCASSSHHSWAVALTNTDSHCSATDSDIATDEGSDEMSHAKECHGSAHVVLYIPQYGTISSLNVVTALGIGLFYAYLDAHHPHARTLVDESNTLSDASSSLRSMLANTMTRLRQYQRRFEHSLPRLPSPTRCGIVSSSASSRRRDGWSYSAAWEEDKDEETRRSLLAIHAGTRPDHRPIHPCYYRMSGKEIRDGHREYRRDLLRLSDMYTRLSLSCQKGARDRPPLHRFGLSALYENDYDQRNFGGLVRNANAFLVDCVCYVGRRRYNVVGAVGSYHYTPPIYIPYRCNDTPSSANEDARRHVTSHTNNRDSNSSNMDCDEEEDDAADSSTDAYRLVRNAQADSRISSDALRCDVEQACGGSCRWWLLDCGQSALYHTSSSSSSSIDSTASTAHCSSVESMRWYREQCARGDGVMSLCDDEYTLRAAIRGCGLLLVVPQEGKLPSMNILQHCEKILTVAPRQSVALDHDGDANSASMRTAAVGLPQQVASGIAFQRLSTIMHPCVKTL